jgi:hypothetical protein
MPLIRRRVSPAKLAAKRANARKSTTGPRTHRGKGGVGVAVNALKHGCYASPKLFRTHLAASGEDVALYDWLYHQMSHVFRPVGKWRWREAERLARKAWCGFRRARKEGLASGWRPPTRSSVWCGLHMTAQQRARFGSKPICAVQSTDPHVMFPATFRIQVGETGVYLAFWVRSGRRRLRLAARVAPRLTLVARIKSVAAKVWSRMVGLSSRLIRGLSV